MTNSESAEITMTELAIPFRGSRDYLAGTDLFSAISYWVSECTGTSTVFVSQITFHRLATHAVRVMLGGSKPPPEAFANFTLDQTSSGSQTTGWLVETSKPVSSRVEYDEAGLVAGAQFDASSKTGTLSIPEEFSTIQALVALTKVLCNRVAPGGGAWLFGRLDLTLPLKHQADTIEVSLKRLIDQRYAILEVRQDAVHVGSIRFIKDTNA